MSSDLGYLNAFLVPFSKYAGAANHASKNKITFNEIESAGLRHKAFS